MEMSKVEEYAKKLEQYEAEKAEKAAKFDVKALIQSSQQIHSVNVEGLGVVQYGVLTLKDTLELAKYASAEEKSAATIWLMLRKAYPDLTLEDVKNMPLDVAAKIMTALNRDMGFLAGKTSQTGRKRT
jgi:hypothetical protein